MFVTTLAYNRKVQTRSMQRFFMKSCPIIQGRLFFLGIFILASMMPSSSFAHPSPNSLVFLDISPRKVSIEIQLPLPELELSFGNEISKKPETLIERNGPQLREYLQAHIHAYVIQGHPWLVEIIDMRMDKSNYPNTDVLYWEIIARVTLTPQPGEDTRNFMLDYDVIMHQVINHAALVSIRSDWETGNISSETAAIGWDIKDNVIYPLEVKLEKGSSWRGFKSLVSLGMKHIAEGTDHLLFLLTLLLSAPLVVSGKTWGAFGGVRYSIVRLFKMVSAFTFGHSLTLLIGALGWVHLPGQLVEIMIAFSILVSAIHAIRPVFPGKEAFVAAGFGLIHGLAFANMLTNLHLDAGQMALSILGFNMGIEAMQLFVIALIVPWLILLSRSGNYNVVRIMGAIFAGIAALAWVTERIFERTNPITALVERLAHYSPWLILSLAAGALFSMVRLRMRTSRQ